MIRKRMGDEFWLITQPDHARLAGALARAWGNRHFAAPNDNGILFNAVDTHDDGWAGHDDAPTLDTSGLPSDVFSMPRGIEHAAWLASAHHARATGDRVGLLVALHGLSLSAVSAAAGQTDRVDDEHRRRQFDLNKIQHALIEQIEALRGVLGYATDRPLRLGLADGWTNAAEEQLKFDFRLLQAVDALSLQLCCDHVPPGVVAQPHARPGAAQVTLRMTPGDDPALRVGPWPFGETVLHVSVPYRAVPVLACDDVDHFRAAYADAEVRTAHAELSAG